MRLPSSAPVALLLAGLALTGCPEPPTDDAPIALFAGYRYDWEELSHRVAYLRAVTHAPSGGVVQADLGIIGGNFSTGGVDSDVPTWTLSWLELDSGHVAVIEGSSELVVDGSGAASVPVSVPLPEAAWPSVDVALRGVTFDSDLPLADGAPGDYDPSHGWTPQRMGAGVRDLAVDGGDATFVAWMAYDAEAANDTDRPTMAANTEFLQLAGTVHWSLLLHRGQVTDSTLSARDYILRDPPFTDIQPLPAAERTLVIEGPEGAPLGVPLLRSWDLTFNATIGREGRYLRAFGARLDTWDYDAERGAGTGVWDLFASHSSLVEEGDLEVDFTVEAALLQLDDPEGAVTLRSATSTSEVGPIEVTLPERP